MLTEAWQPLFYHAEQMKLWRTADREAVVPAGRGSGKTELARRRIVRYLPVRKPWPNPIYIYALPTIAQGRRIAWNPIKALVPEHWIKSVNETRMTITTVFGSELRVVGTEKAIRIEGEQIDGLVMDESSDQKPGVFSRTFRPMLSHRRAWWWRIGVPKRFGAGAREFKEAFDKAKTKGSGFTWPSWDILDDKEIAAAREDLDEKDFNEQYGAAWETVSGLAYHAYDDVLNVVDVSYQPDKPLLIGSDFNVDPMAWVIGQQVNDKTIAIIDEVWSRNTHTGATLDALYARYSSHDAGFLFFGDASGRARRSSATTTDYLLIKNDRRFGGSRVFYPEANPPISSRVAAVNAQLKNANGERRLLVHSRCKHLRKDLATLAFEPGTRDVDKSHPDAGHITDALGYLIHRTRPVMQQEQTAEEPGLPIGIY